MAKSIKLQCTCCGKEKPPTTGFYLSQSPLYKFNEGRMTICKECLFDKYEELTVRYNDETKALYHLCMMLDIYFSKDLVDSAYKQSNRKNSKKGLLMTYITKLNSLPQYKGMGSFQSDYVILDENVIKEIEEKYKVENKETEIQKEDTIDYDSIKI
ncbi:MAG TPA: hypothetical protein VLM92_12210, partial [Romboutsia sp.]|nr:hypothetical protein [Romboutsia sp.]